MFIDSADVVPPHLHLASSTLRNRNSIESNVSLTMKSDCLHHLGGGSAFLQSGGMGWVSGKGGIVGRKAKKVPLRCFLLHSGSVLQSKSKVRHWVFLLFWNSFVAPACANPTRSTSGVCQVIGFSGEDVAHHAFYPAEGQGERIQGCKKRNGSKADNDGWYSQSNKWQFLDSARVALKEERVCKLDSCRLRTKGCMSVQVIFT